MKALRIPLLLAAALLSTAFDVPKDHDRYAEFKPQMQAVYASLIQVMKVLLKDAEVTDGKERAALEAQFRNLAERSQVIRDIAAKSDRGHQVLASELAKSTQMAHAQFKAGNMTQTRFFLSDVVNTCFTCHTSRSSDDSKFVINFQKDLNWSQFEPLSKARFLALSRQFEAAAREYEQLFSSQTLSADSLINLDPFVEYLIVSIRVRDDAASVLKTLQGLKMDGYPELVKKDLSAWISELKAQEGQKKARGSALDQAKSHMARARASMEYPRDRAGLIQYILASKILHELVNAKDSPPANKAEAYYLLGITELSIGSSLFADESIAYFEEAIRLQPRSALAKKAFAQLEENLLFAYTGSSGVNLPEDEKKRLDELRKLAN